MNPLQEPFDLMVRGRDAWKMRALSAESTLCDYIKDVRLGTENARGYLARIREALSNSDPQKATSISEVQMWVDAVLKALDYARPS